MRTALGSATICQSRCRSICSGRRRRSSSRSSSSHCSCARGPAPRARAQVGPARHLFWPARSRAACRWRLSSSSRWSRFSSPSSRASWATRTPTRTLPPRMVWIIGWVGVAYVSAFVGDLWAVVNPWRTLFRLTAGIAHAISGRAGLSFKLPYPAALGVWPAFFLLLALSWVELVYPNPAVPRFIASLAVAYSLLTLDRDVSVRPRNMAAPRRGLFAGLRHIRALCAARHTHRTAAAIEAAAVRRGAHRERRSLDFDDGVRAAHPRDACCTTARSATPEWGRFESVLAAHFSAFGDFKLMALRTAGLFAFWLIFFGTYLAVSALMSVAVGGALPPLVLARSFALTLVPIAIGYHLAHYLTFLLIQGQYIIPLVSDPFGFGWNLFGTAGYRVDIGIVDARFAWYAAVGAILIGPHRRGLSRPSQGDRAFCIARRGVALASSAHRADGGLYLRQLEHPRRADCRASRPGATVRDRDRARRAGRRCSPAARQRPSHQGRCRHDRQAEIDLSRPRLRLPRRHAHDRCRSALFLHVRLPLGSGA